jgi:PAS domain S-box-containing protein
VLCRTARDRVAMPDEVIKSGEQKAAEAEVVGFEKELGPFVVAAETTRMPMVFTDAKASDNAIIFANEAFLRLTGYDEHEVLGQGFNFLMERGADPEALAEIQTAFESGRDLERPLRYRRKNGTTLWVTIFITAVTDEGGTVVQHFASFVDITRHKETEDHLRFLLNELNHRTQNTLATVLAIAGQTLRGMTGEETIATLDARILALSKVHALLGAADWDKVSLRDVLEEILRPFGLADRLSIECEDVCLAPKALLSLAMVFHELATNAVKYGALATATVGRIDISCGVDPISQGQQLRLRWQESGGPAVSPPTRKGFGSRLIRGVAQEVNGKVSLYYDRAGVVCDIVMPMSEDGEWARL